jgi:hypothetical protein
MSYDASAEALRCPFCGGVELEKRADAPVLAPNAVVPFAVDKQQAVVAMRRWLGRGFWRPSDLARAALVVDLSAVFVPYWVFTARTYTNWTADTDQTPPRARGDWYPLAGEHRSTYDGVLVGASSVLTPAETHAIAPFDLSRAVPPNQVDLDNVIVEQFSVARKFARPLAKAGLEQLEADACRQAYVPGKARNVKVNVRIEALAGQPTLLPVWVMAYRYQDRVYRFLLNGQTGRATGQAPVSWYKISAAVAVAALVALGVIVAIVATAG